MKKKSLKKNAAYSFIKAFMNLAFPLISFPYASRVLLPAGIGKVNFANSIIDYFILIAGLGISSYASREAVRVRDDKHLLNKIFREILAINLISTLISYTLLVFALLFVNKFYEYRILLIVCSTKVLFTTIGVDWIFKVEEEYKYITIRSIFFQFTSLILLFVFVHNQNDYIVYAFIGVFSSVGSNICNIFYSRRFVNFFEKTTLNIKKHLKPIFIFFGMSVATRLYTALDSVMLGFIMDDNAVGYYSAANKIKSLAVGLITAIISTLLPRASYYLGKNKEAEYKKIISKAFDFTCYFSIPAAIGTMSIAKPLILVFSGKDFLGALVPMLVISPVIIFISISSFADNIVLLPQKLEKISLQAQIAGAVFNIALNYFMIPRWGVFGAAFSTFLVEFLVTFYKIFFSFRFLYKLIFFKNLIKVVASSIFMSICIFALIFFVKSVFMQLILGIFIGIFTYAFTTVLLKNDTALILLNTIRNNIRKIRLYRKV